MAFVSITWQQQSGCLSIMDVTMIGMNQDAGLMMLRGTCWQDPGET